MLMKLLGMALVGVPFWGLYLALRAGQRPGDPPWLPAAMTGVLAAGYLALSTCHGMRPDPAQQNQLEDVPAREARP